MYSLLVLTSMSWPLYLDRLVSRSWTAASCCLRDFWEAVQGGPGGVEADALLGHPRLDLRLGRGNAPEARLPTRRRSFSACWRRTRLSRAGFIGATDSSTSGRPVRGIEARPGQRLVTESVAPVSSAVAGRSAYPYASRSKRHPRCLTGRTRREHKGLSTSGKQPAGGVLANRRGRVPSKKLASLT